MRRSLLISVHVVAYKRFVDYVPMIIDYHLLKGFNRTIHDFLFKSLALGGEDACERCTMYLEEDPEVVNQRTTLSSMLNRMEIARVELLKVSCYYFFVTACELRAVHRHLHLHPQSLILPTILAPSHKATGRRRRRRLSTVRRRRTSSPRLHEESNGYLDEAVADEY